MKTLIINAVECEPYITADYKLMSLNVELLVKGVEALFKMSCAKECKVCIWSCFSSYRNKGTLVI